MRLERVQTRFDLRDLKSPQVTCSEVAKRIRDSWICLEFGRSSKHLLSQVTLYGGVEISGHNGPALDLSGNSQANVSGANNLHNNGVAGDPRSAAVRLDGNSELFLRSGTIAQNTLRSYERFAVLAAMSYFFCPTRF